MRSEPSAARPKEFGSVQFAHRYPGLDVPMGHRGLQCRLPPPIMTLHSGSGLSLPVVEKSRSSTVSVSRTLTSNVVLTIDSLSHEHHHFR